MRVSANPGPHYIERGVDADVTLDGQIVSGVLEADEEGGWMDVLVTGNPDQPLPAKEPVSVRRLVDREGEYDAEPHPRFKVARYSGDVRVLLDSAQ